MDYLLGRVDSAASIGKGKFFRDILGFTDETLESALTKHLIDNFDNAIFGNTKAGGLSIEIVGEIVGPNGNTSLIKTVWEVLEDGTCKLVTSHPFHP